MNVLVACEYSGVVSQAFAKRGHFVVSADLLPSEWNDAQHIQGDVLPLLRWRWDLVIGHPPCTYLANSGVRWLYNADGTKNEERWENMAKGAEFFLAVYNANAKHIAVENPIMHKYARDIIGMGATQFIQPWQFGHGETKRTGLWLKNLPALTPTNIVPGREPRVHHMAPSPERWKERSRTYEGFGEAMASQWNF